MDTALTKNGTYSARGLFLKMPCPICKDTTPIATKGLCSAKFNGNTDHRWCFVEGLEQNLYQTKDDWVKACKPKKKIIKVTAEMLKELSQMK